MKKGVILYAHNNRQLDYAKMAIVAGGLAKKNLKVPVSMVTDPSTVDWMRKSNDWKTALKVFDDIISVDRPHEDQMRYLNDGVNKFTTLFKNTNRGTVWDVTPYDRTLMIDTDFFILSDTLNNYWDTDSSLLISSDYNDVQGSDRIGYLDRYVSDTGVKLLWATTVMFTKNEESKTFFDLVNYVRVNYRRFADLYRFDPRLYRNDISFSIARHIMYGFETDNDYRLPSVLSSIDRDVLFDVDPKGKLTLLLNNREGFVTTSIANRDIHIMNKSSIVRNIDKLMELI